MKLFIIIENDNDPIAAMLANEALSDAAQKQLVDLHIEIHDDLSKINIPLAKQPTDILLFVSSKIDTTRLEELTAVFNGKVIVANKEKVLHEPHQFLKNIIQQGKLSEQPAAKIKHIVAVTSCPTGVAHTFMAAEALINAAEKLGIHIRVETQGSIGAETPLTQSEIKAADLVIIAADREVDRSRFDGKEIYISGTKAAIQNGEAFITTAINNAHLQPVKGHSPASAGSASENIQENRSNPYKHLMTGVTYMLPFVVAGGLLIALAFAFGGIHVDQAQSGFAHDMFIIGARGAFALMVPALAGYIAFSIADRPGIAPGMVGGMIANQIGAGFLGGILAGFIAGYVIFLAKRFIILPKNLQAIMPVLILPLLGTFVTGILMITVIGPPVAALLGFLIDWLKSLQGANALFLGLLIGAMMAVDMGGPINKAAYAFSTMLIAEGIYAPMAAAMIAGMTPPIALALATSLFPSRFTEDERNSKGATFILGLAFISEGAIPFAARNPFQVIPSLIIGSAVAGAISMVTATGLQAPHGGIFLLFIPGVVINYIGYFSALIIGVIMTTLALGLICRPLTTLKMTTQKKREAQA